MSCGACGVRRGHDVEFFLDDDAPAVTDEALLAEANAGPDWLCETCGGSNRSHVEACQTCGAPPGNSRLREVTEGPLGAFRDQQSDETGERRAADEARYSMGGYGSGRTYGGASIPGEPYWMTITRIASIAAAALIVLVIIGLALHSVQSRRVRDEPGYYDPQTTTRSVELVVERVGWLRSVEVEQFRQVTDEGWEGEVPDGARVLSRRQAVHHHDRVKVGSHTVPEYYTERVRTGTRTETEYYTDQEYGGTEQYHCGTRNKGNGYFEDVYCTRPVYRTVTKTRNKTVDDYQTVTRTRDRVVEDFKDVPVYQTKVTYTVKRWVAVDRAVAQGEDLAPRWPEVAVSKTRREGRRVEKYTVYLRDPQSSRPYEREVTAEELALFAAGARCTGKVNGFDHLVAITPQALKGSQ